MKDRGLTIDRVGALAGCAFVVLFAAIIAASPSLPAPQHPIAQIAEHARSD